MDAERKKEIDDALGKFFFGCNIPFVTVESEYLINFVHLLNSNYNPPSRKTLSGPILDNHYDELITSVKHNETQDGVLLLDGWKNSVANSQNVVAIVRTNEQNAFLKSFDFSCIRETGEALSEVVQELIHLALEMFNVNIFAVVTDNASNMLNMGRRVEIWHLTCNSHSGNLLFKSMTNQDLDTKVNNISKDFKTSNIERKLRDAGAKKMILYAETRWCSRRNSYRRCLENIPIMRNIIQDNQLLDRNEQFKFKEGVIESILNPNFENNLIDAILVFDTVCELINTCQKTDCSISVATEKWLHLQHPGDNQNFENVVQERLSKVINKYTLAANFLHPAYKGQRFQYNEQYGYMKNQFFQENLSRNGQVELMDYTLQRGIFEEIFRQNHQCWKTFWRTAQPFSPELANLAKRLLQIPASTGDLERLFLSGRWFIAK